MYRLCNGGQGFYHGRALIYTGTKAKGVASAPAKMVQIVAESLGAKFKLKRSRGCLGLKKALPKPKNALGFVRQCAKMIICRLETNNVLLH